MTSLQIRMLGGFDLTINGQDLRGEYTERLILLLSYLSLHRHMQSSRKQVAFLFWPDSSEEQARTNLRNLLHVLKKTLPQVETFLEADQQFIGWKKEADIHIDVVEFLENIKKAERAVSGEARAALIQTAVSLYQGELLPGHYQDWILVERENLQQMFITTLMNFANHLEESREYDHAIQITNRLLKIDALNENIHEQAMRLHALNNDMAGALQVYHACVSILNQELGIEPSRAIKNLYSRIMQSGGGVETTEPRQASSPLVGRKAEWKALQSIWKEAIKGKPSFVLVEGDAGMGKTRLASEMMQWTRRQGIITCFAQCHPAEGDLPFAPVIAWLRSPGIQTDIKILDDLWRHEIARLLPEFPPADTHKASKTDPQQSKWQRHRLFEAIARALTGRGSMRLFVLDDIQWGDRDTLDFLHYFIRCNEKMPMCILATMRLGESEAGHPLQSLRQTLSARSALTELELKPLSQDEIAQIAKNLAGERLPEGQIENLYRETEGNPFFALELLRAGVQGPMPENLRAVLYRRLDQLSAKAREVAEVAACMGREFDAHLLIRAARMDEMDVIRALDELWSKRILQTRQDETYGFTHGKLQDAAYETMSAVKKRVFHRHIAETLSAGDAEKAIIAGHFESAGMYRQAFENYINAARDARRVFANGNAITHYERAVLMLEKSGIHAIEENKSAREIHEALGFLYDLSNEPKKSFEEYSQALGYAEADPVIRARLTGKMARAIGANQDFEGSKEKFIQAIEILGVPPPQQENDWWLAWLDIQFDRIWMHYDFGFMDGMEALMQEARPVVERLGQTEKLSEYYFLLPTLVFRRDGYRIDETVLEYSRLALDLSLETANHELLTRTHFGYGFINFLAGNAQDAIRYLDEGLRRSRQIGYTEYEILCITYLAAAYRSIHDVEPCAALAEKGLELCEREDARSYAATCRANLGWAAWMRGDEKKAESLCRRALEGWSIYYPFQWYGVWLLLELATQAQRGKEAVEFARLLKKPGQQIFDREADDLLIRAIELGDQGRFGQSLENLQKASAWAKENNFL